MKQADKHVFRSLSSKIFFRIFVVYFFIASVLTAFQMVDVYLRHKHSFMHKMDTYGQSIKDVYAMVPFYVNSRAFFG